MAKFYNAPLLIRKLISIFLIGVFSFSIMPVAWLHDLIANHKDICYHNFQQQGKQVTQADINCHCISFVAEAQFINSYPPVVFIIPQTELHASNYFYTEDFFSQHHFFSELRGPPSFL